MVIKSAIFFLVPQSVHQFEYDLWYDSVLLSDHKLTNLIGITLHWSDTSFMLKNKYQYYTDTTICLYCVLIVDFGQITVMTDRIIFKILSM